MTQRSRGPKRRTTWVDVRVNQAMGNASQTIASLTGPFGSDDTHEWTITRVIGRLHAVTADATAAFTIQRVAVGIGVVSQEAFSASVVPDPEFDTDFPVEGWLVKMHLHPMWEAEVGGIPEVVDFDIHAQRRIRGNEPVIIIENNLARGTSTEVEVNGLIRVLYLM